MLIPHYAEQRLFNRTILTVSVEVENADLLSAFLNFDIVSFEDAIMQLFDRVLLGVSDREQDSGNACGFIIEKETTRIYDLADEESDICCTVNTNDLYALILAWSERRREFYEKNNQPE